MKIKAVSEYEFVYASNECEIPALKIEHDGTCSMIYASILGCTAEIHNRIVLVIPFTNYCMYDVYDGPILSFSKFEKFIKQNEELIKSILDGWGHPYLDFSGNYICDLTEEAVVALKQLCFLVNYYYNGVSPLLRYDLLKQSFAPVPSFLLDKHSENI